MHLFKTFFKTHVAKSIRKRNGVRLFFCWNASKYFADNAKWVKATFMERQVKALTHYQLCQLLSHSDS